MATDTVSNHVYIDDVKLYAGVNELIIKIKYFFILFYFSLNNIICLFIL